MKITNLFIILLTIFSCEHHKTLQKRKATLIISNPSKIITNFGTGIDLKSLDRLNQNTDKTNDTINVAINKYRKVYLKNENTFKFFICERNDTVFIDISEDNIDIAFKNKTIKKYDTLPLTPLYSKYLSREISELKLFKNKLFKKDEWTQEVSVDQQYIVSNDNAFSDYHNMLKNLTSKSNKIVQALFENDSIRGAQYNYYKSQNNYEEFSTTLDAFNISNNTYLKAKIFGYFETDDILKDDFIAYGYVNRLLSDIYVDKYRYNYKTVFDSLPSQISGDVLKHAQLLCLREIASIYDHETFEFYANKYLSGPNGYKEMKEIVRKIEEEYALGPRVFNEKNIQGLQLNDINGNTTNLEEVLIASRGNVVYIDFWASWCKPCRASMPASKKLREDYSGEEIKFIFISIDENEEKWIQASKAEGLENYTANLLATNFPSAKIYEALELKSIPRYLLFDRNGRLVNRNAPRPDSDIIVETINELLSPP